MSWIVLAFSAALSWGLYGASLHRGQVELGNPMKAMLCVGVAYFLIAVLVPVGGAGVPGRAAQLQHDRDAHRDPGRRARRARRGLHHLCVSQRRHAVHRDAAVFGGAPIVNVLASWDSPAEEAPSPLLYLGFLMAAAGASMVLHRHRIAPPALACETGAPLYTLATDGRPCVSLPCNG